MAIRNLNQIIASFVSFIQTKIPTLSLLSGTVGRDVVIESPSQEFANVYTELARVESLQILNDSTAFQGNELDNLASNYGLTRLGGTQATVDVTFRVPSLTADILIPAGTGITTSPTQLSPTIISFTTVVTAQFVASTAPTYYNPLTGLYELTVAAIAISTGTSSNVASSSINTILTAIGNAPSITVTNNLAAVGGSSAESDASLLARIKLKETGNNIGTANGILSIVNSNSSVVDSLLVRPGDIELLRDQYGNSVDAIVLGESIHQSVEPHIYTAGQYNISLNRQPVRAVTLVSGFVSAIPHTFVLGTDYTVTIDDTSLFLGTVDAVSKITFLPTGTLPDASSTVTITYSYNKLIQDLQAVMDGDSVKIVGSDLLVKEATKVLIQVGASIVTFPGYTHADVVVSAVTNLTAYIDGLKLGVDADQSKISAVIQDTPGVVEVIPGSLTILAKRPTDPGFIAVTDVVIKRTEYGRADTITII